MINYVDLPLSGTYGDEIHSPTFDPWLRYLYPSTKGFTLKPDEPVVFVGCGGGTTAPAVSGGNITLTTPCGITTIPVADVRGTIEVLTFTAAGKKKYRALCKSIPECAGGIESSALTFQYRQSGTGVIEREYIVQPFPAGCDYTCTERNTLVAQKINAELSSILVASVESVTGALIVEAKVAGFDFEMFADAGYMNVQVMKPNIRKFGYGQGMQAMGYPVTCLDPASDKSFKFVGITFKKEISGHGHGTMEGYRAGGGLTSTEARFYALVAFEDSACNTYYTNFLSALTSAGLTVNSTAQNRVLYDYTIQSTDAGDAAALATIKSNYAAAITVERMYYTGTVSYYQVRTTSATKPVAVGGDATYDGTWSGVY